MQESPLTEVGQAEPATWGRRSEVQWGHTFAALAIICLAPSLVLLDWIALEHYRGSIGAAVLAARSENTVRFIFGHVPRVSAQEAGLYATWLLWQVLLYRYLPGPSCTGQLTPGGSLLTYTANGLAAWILTHLLYFAASALQLIDPAAIATHWGGLLSAANCYGFLLAVYVQFKGYHFPSFPEDCKFTGSWVFDYFAGVELNPRSGFLDLKFFHNSRPGIIAWTLIDLSWASYQYNTFGTVTDSMIVVLILQALYVLDLFWNERWYARTVDISHDHFGFMLAWGDTTFLPSFYTLQVQYLARYPVHMPRAQALAILSLGLVGYSIFRSANDQRYRARERPDDPALRIWGAPPKYIPCKYRTTDGNEHRSMLLVCGWWGLARHANYLGDLILAWSMCAACGFAHFLPWSYFFYLCVLLGHRAQRDERRCRGKYGKQWEEYCAAVPHLLIPGVY